LLVVSLTDLASGESAAKDLLRRVGTRALAARELANHPDDEEYDANQKSSHYYETDRP
jgi:hypothetical protein